MKIFSRPPTSPYRNLVLAAILGVPVGSFLESVRWAATVSFSGTPPLALVSEALMLSGYAYLPMALLVLFYGLPALWLAIRIGRAGPGTALLFAALPGVCFSISSAVRGTFGWLLLLVSLATGLVFVALAYRNGPSEHSSKPLRGST
jgi:hypothetical protein